MKQLSPREKLVELLRSLDEVLTAWNAGSKGDGPLLMPSLYGEGSYAELERSLVRMREEQRTLWWHVSQRYRWGNVEKQWLTCRRTRQGPQPLLPPRSELVSVLEIQGNRVRCYLHTWNAKVESPFVEAGLDWLLTVMYSGAVERIHLPVEILYRALGIPPRERSADRTAKVTSATG